MNLYVKLSALPLNYLDARVKLECVCFSVDIPLEGIQVRTEPGFVVEVLSVVYELSKCPEPDSSTPRLHIELLYLYFGSHIIFKVESEERGDYAEEPDIRV